MATKREPFDVRLRAETRDELAQWLYRHVAHALWTRGASAEGMPVLSADQRNALTRWLSRHDLSDPYQRDVERVVGADVKALAEKKSIRKE